MLTYHLEIEDQTIADKIMAFFNTLPANTVKLSKEEYDEELEALVDEGFASKVVGTHEEVFTRLSAKYGV